MIAPALLLAFSLLAQETPPADAAGAAPPPTAAAPAPTADAEPLPPGAPTDDYQLTAWCYGALSEYLDIYEHVKPDLIKIDKLYGSSVPDEAQPYAQDMAAAHKELKVLARAVEAAEKASPRPIAPEGVEAIKRGQSIWRPAEEKTSRELARAWLSWGMPDRCDSTARSLATRSALLGKALNYDSPPPSDAPPPPADEAMVLKPIARSHPADAAPPPADAPASAAAPTDTAPTATAAPDASAPAPAPADPAPAPAATPDPNGPIPDRPTPPPPGA